LWVLVHSSSVESFVLRDPAVWAPSAAAAAAAGVDDATDAADNLAEAPAAGLFGIRSITIHVIDATALLVGILALRRLASISSTFAEPGTSDGTGRA
jgi:hypothetical protein